MNSSAPAFLEEFIQKFFFPPRGNAFLSSGTAACRGLGFRESVI